MFESSFQNKNLLLSMIIINKLIIESLVFTEIVEEIRYRLFFVVQQQAQNGHHHV